MNAPQKMTVAEWNEFARNCTWAIIEPAYEFESEEERAEFLAWLDELFGDDPEPAPPKKQFNFKKIFGQRKIQVGREQDRRN